MFMWLQEVSFDASKNVTVCPEVGVWELTKKS